MERFSDSYAEISPSGSGIKIWAKGKLPGEGTAFPLGDGRVEIYDQGRYFTVTGNHWAGQMLDVEEHQAALDWLLAAQNPDGGWGGMPGIASSIEETAVALHACTAHPKAIPATVIRRATEFLMQTTDQGRRTVPSPIGFYFASLWYFEELYPLIFAAAALQRVRSQELLRY